MNLTQDEIVAARTQMDNGACAREQAEEEAVKYPFRLTDKALEFAEEPDEEEGEVEWRFVCSRLAIVATTRSETSEDWGRLLVFKDGDEVEHAWSLPMDMLAGDGLAYRERLLSMGLIIAPGRKARDRLHLYIASTTPEVRARAVPRLGWYNVVFVLPDVVIGQSKEKILFQSASPIEHAFRVRGDLMEWKREVAAHCAGNSRLVFAISAAFAAPLVHLLGEESGGFHFSGGSSQGKTTSIVVAGSVWGGGGLHGFLRQWRATANGLEGVAALHSDSLLCLDEISQVSAREAGEVAYMLANGQGKSRARRDGSGRPPAVWRTLFLSTGEISLADKVFEDGRRRATAGQELRVLDVPADAGRERGMFEDFHGFDNGHLFAAHLKDAAGRFYGAPIRAFLAEIVGDLDAARTTLKKFRDNFVADHYPAEADKQVRRAIERFALVASAGELAIALGIVPWTEGEAAAGAGVCFKAWLEQRGGTGPAEVEGGISQVRRFFELHGEARFTPWDGAGDRPTLNRAGLRRLTDGGVEFYVFPEVFKSELCSGFDSRVLARAMVDRGFLIPGSDGKISESCTLPGLGKKRVYHFRGSIMGDEQ